MKPSDISIRMKQYEEIHTGQRLMPRLPVIARVDGRAFHSLLRKADKPFDLTFLWSMRKAMLLTCQDFRPDLGYTQSDEISFLWKNETGEMPFGGKVQKLSSVIASTVTRYFSYGGMFDCRVYQVPNLTEAVNALVWRELDAARNSLQMVARSLYSHNELLGKKNQDLHEMLREKAINWDNVEPALKRGVWCYQRNGKYGIGVTKEPLAQMINKQKIFSQNSFRRIKE